MGRCPNTPPTFEKVGSNLSVKCNFIAFLEKIISFVIKIYFFKNFAKKISFALLLNRKSCICCHKHCRAYFRRHMECAVLKRFLKVQGTFSIKKFLQIPLYHLEKFNLNHFISILYKTSPHTLILILSII